VLHHDAAAEIFIPISKKIMLESLMSCFPWKDEREMRYTTITNRPIDFKATDTEISMEALLD
jgi:hypothetical protein